jgi:hypothetical protein
VARAGELGALGAGVSSAMNSAEDIVASPKAGASSVSVTPPSSA